MNLATIRSQIETWIKAEYPDIQIFWKNRPKGYHQPQYIIAEIKVPMIVGSDSLTYQHNGVTDDLTPQVRGNRTFTLQLQARSFRPVDGYDAHSITTTLMTSLRKPSTIGFFIAASIGVRRVLSNSELSQLARDREMSIAQLEISFHADASVDDTNIPYVKKYGVETDTLQYPDGTDFEIQIDEIIE